MRILLVPIGSAGDVYPFIGIGLELKARGHHVTLYTSDHFRQIVESLGIEFASMSRVDSISTTTPVRSMKGWRTALKESSSAPDQTVMSLTWLPFNVVLLWLLEAPGAQATSSDVCKFRIDELVGALPAIVAEYILDALDWVGWAHKPVSIRFSS